MSSRDPEWEEEKAWGEDQCFECVDCHLPDREHKFPYCEVCTATLCPQCYAGTDGLCVMCEDDPEGEED